MKQLEKNPNDCQRISGAKQKENTGNTRKPETMEIRGEEGLTQQRRGKSYKIS